MKPIAYLAISTRPTSALLYELTAGDTLVWASLGYDSDSGRQRTRERLRAWLVGHPYKVVLKEERRRA